jgi:hypothetical protein
VEKKRKARAKIGSQTVGVLKFRTVACAIVLAAVSSDGEDKHVRDSTIELSKQAGALLVGEYVMSCRVFRRVSTEFSNIQTLRPSVVRVGLWVVADYTLGLMIVMSHLVLIWLRGQSADAKIVGAAR